MKYFFLISVVSLIFISCDYNNIRTKSEQPALISEYVIPELCNVNETLNLKFTMEATSGCFYDLRLEMKQTSERVFSISAFGTFNGDLVCPAVLVRKDTVVNFTPSVAGDYYFTIKLNSSTLAKDTLSVK